MATAMSGPVLTLLGVLLLASSGLGEIAPKLLSLLYTTNTISIISNIIIISNINIILLLLSSLFSFSSYHYNYNVLIIFIAIIHT